MRILFTLFIFISINLFSQSKVDTIIVTDAYKSYFSFKYKEPIWVSYRLYKGGGDCSRSEFKFKNDTQIKTATDLDYLGSGYDRGHLANAEDFANNCRLDELTFRYYNCLPQKPGLNRGAWKQWETIIRKESQTDSLLVICGGVFGKKVIGDSLAVPDYCWKIVKSLSTNKIKHILWFVNSGLSDKVEVVTIPIIEKRIGNKIPLTY